MQKTVFALAALLALLFVLTTNALATSKVERHPKIRQAISALEAAKNDLQNAAHDYCGHRVEALEAVNQAIDQLNQALASDTARNTRPNAPALVPAAYSVERHPMIQRAINALNAARADLQQAARDFKGHRAEALEAVNRAQEQLRLAIACDKN